MKKSQLKQILKPLIKECIKEVMFEDGVLSGIIGEVSRGIAAPQIEAASPPVDPTLARMQRNTFSAEQGSKMKAQKKKLMEAIGSQAYNGIDLFEGATPGPQQLQGAAAAAPLAGVEAGDAGVDISNLFGSVGNSWGAHMQDVSARKK